MSSITTSDWWRGEVDWETPAGLLLRRFFATLPAEGRFHLVLYGSAPLQLTLNRTWLSADVDFFSDDDEAFNELVRRAGLAKIQGDFYLEPGFRTTSHMRARAKTVQLGHVTVTIPHPLDILIGKLDRLDPKDLLAFRRVRDLENAIESADCADDADSEGDGNANGRISEVRLPNGSAKSV